MNRPRRLVASGILASILVLLAATLTFARPRAHAATARCAASGLVIWLDTNGNGATGSAYYQLRFTNLSGSRCTLGGYPGVSAVGLSGAQVGRAASRDRTRAPITVSLVGGATASAVLRIVEAANYPPTTCRMVTAAGIRVYPPGSRSAKLVPFPFAACSRRGPTYLSVQAIR